MAGPLPQLTSEAVYKKLQEYYKENGEKINIKNLFDNDAERFKKFRYVKHMARSPYSGEIVTYVYPNCFENM